MAKLKIELNRKGVRELLQSKEIMEACVSVAKNAASRAGAGYEADNGFVGKTRVSAIVYPSTQEARQDNYQNNTLLKVFGGALKVRK